MCEGQMIKPPLFRASTFQFVGAGAAINFAALINPLDRSDKMIEAVSIRVFAFHESAGTSGRTVQLWLTKENPGTTYTSRVSLVQTVAPQLGLVELVDCWPARTNPMGLVSQPNLTDGGAPTSIPFTALTDSEARKIAQTAAGNGTAALEMELLHAGSQWIGPGEALVLRSLSAGTGDNFFTSLAWREWRPEDAAPLFGRRGCK